MSKNVVIIVDPFSTAALYAAVLNKKGFRCYAVLSDKNLSPYFLNSYTSLDMADEQLYSSSEIKEVIAPEQVAAVITGAETGVCCAEKLAAFYKAPGNNCATTAWRRKKSAMQQRLRESGLHYIKSELITRDNFADFSLADFQSNTGYVVKPEDSCLTDGVMFFTDKESTTAWIASTDWQSVNVMGRKNESYLVQERLVGDEYVVDLVAFNKEIKVCSLCKYRKGLHNGSHFVYESLEVLDIFDSRYNTLIAYAIDCAHALGIEHGPAHMELIQTRQTPVLIEVGARLHGGIAPLLFEECYTDGLLSSAAGLVSASFSTQHSKRIKRARIVFLITENMGIILKNRESLLQKLTAVTGVRQVKLLFRENETLPINN